MDVLADMLDRSRARGAAFAHTSMTGHWALVFDGGPGLAVHAMLDGEGLLLLDGERDRIALLPGDVVLVRGTRAHRLADRPGTRPVTIAELLRDGAVPGSTRRFAGGDGTAGIRAGFFCGAYRFEGDLCAELLDALPDVVHVRPAAGSPLRTALDLLAHEIGDETAAQQTMLDRLLDVVLVHLLREHLRREGTQAPPWYRALDADPQIAAALSLLHDDPARAWTVAELATAVNLSRAAFARRFSALLGSAPLEYLTSWRMALARERLRDTDDRLAAVAQAVGYASEFSFAAAFKRAHGVAPGRWRRQSRLPGAAGSRDVGDDRVADGLVDHEGVVVAVDGVQG